MHVHIYNNNYQISIIELRKKLLNLIIIYKFNNNTCRIVGVKSISDFIQKNYINNNKEIRV